MSWKDAPKIGETKKQKGSLRDRLLGNVSVAPSEESASYFKPDDFRWAETLQGDDSPTGRPIIHVNDAKFQEAGAENYRDKVVIAESLHTLKDVDPDRYQALRQAAVSSPEYMDWARQSYEHAKRQGEQRDFDKWHDASRFDQVIGGYLFAQDPAFPTLKDWSREELPFGAALREELESLRGALGMVESTDKPKWANAPAVEQTEPAEFQAPSIARESTLKVSPLAIVGSDYGTFDTGIPLGEGATRQLTRAGRGIQDVWQGLNQLVRGEEYTDKVNAEIEMYEQGLKASGHDGTDWMRGFGSAATPLSVLPGGGQTKAAQAGLGAVSGGVTGTTLFNPSGKAEDRLANTVTGAAVGAVAAPVAKTVLDRAVQGVAAIGRNLSARAARGTIERQVRNAVGESWDDLGRSQRDAFLDEVQRQLDTSGAVDPEMLSRKANLIANDVQPTKSMVTRNPADWTVERNLQKVSGPGDTLADIYRSNDQALTNRLQNVSGRLPEGTPEAQGQRVMQSIKDLADATQEEVGALYEQVRRTQGDNLASDARNLVGTLDELQDSTYAENLVGSVRNKLKRFGMIDDQGELTTNTLTVKQAEELRKFVNKLPNDFGKRDIIQAIDADVLEGLGEDAFQGARQAARERFDLLSSPAIQKALGAWDELAQGKTAQNFIKSQVVDAAEQDVASLMKALNVMDDPTPALQSMRAGVLEYLQSKAVNPNSGQFSGAGLNKAIRQVGPQKLRMVLGEEAFNRLDSLSRAATDATYQPPYASVNYSNTAPTLMRLAQTGRYVPLLSDVSDHASQAMKQRADQRMLQTILQAPPVNEAERQAQEQARRELTARLLRSTPAITGAAATNQGGQ